MATPLKERLSLFHHVKWEHCVAGVSGGVLSTLVLHPLDLVKIRFQVNEGVAAVGTSRPQYRGIFDALVTIGRADGVRGLYQGVAPNVWGAGASWGLYFLFYNALKQRRLDLANSSTLPASEHMIAAAQSGALTLAMSNPIWVAKTRLCLQYDRAASSSHISQPSSHTYKGMADCLLKIYQVEGVRGLYRGFVPGIVGVSHGAVQFMTYEELKKIYNEYKQRPLDTKFSSTEYIVLAAISKIVAASATYPYQVVRSRLQDQHRSYTGAIDVVKQTWKNERIRGFYKGLSPYMLHVTPNICIVLLVYEHFIEKFGQKEQDRRVHSHSISSSRSIPNSSSISSSSKHDVVQEQKRTINSNKEVTTPTLDVADDSYWSSGLSGVEELQDSYAADCSMMADDEFVICAWAEDIS